MSLGLLTHRCTIKRSAPTNVAGVLQPNWATLAANVRCLIQEKTGKTGTAGGGAGLEYDAVCFLPPGTNVRPRGTDDNPDQILHTTPATNVLYLVRFVADRSGKAHHLTAYLKRCPAE